MRIFWAICEAEGGRSSNTGWTNDLWRCGRDDGNNDSSYLIRRPPDFSDEEYIPDIFSSGFKLEHSRYIHMNQNVIRLLIYKAHMRDLCVYIV